MNKSRKLLFFDFLFFPIMFISVLQTSWYKEQKTKVGPGTKELIEYLTTFVAEIQLHLH